MLPRIILLKPYLDDDTKILMFGAPYEAGWLELLNISLDRVEVYDPTATYCADELLLPNPSHIITPAKEGILMVSAGSQCLGLIWDLFYRYEIPAVSA